MAYLQSSPVLSSEAFIEQVCKVLGIEPEYVISITITAQYYGNVQVQVERVGTQELLQIPALQPDADASVTNS